jgi:hypothetical protein
VDGDGRDDLVVGAPRSAAGFGTGYAIVVSRRPPVQIVAAERRTKIVAIALRCPGADPAACRGRLTLTLGSHKLGSKTFKVSAGHRRTVLVPSDQQLHPGDRPLASATMSDDARTGGVTRARLVLR